MFLSISSSSSPSSSVGVLIKVLRTEIEGKFSTGAFQSHLSIRNRREIFHEGLFNDGCLRENELAIYCRDLSTLCAEGVC